jgi:unsaturated chondroitin disaccharide hydrolase
MRIQHDLTPSSLAPKIAAFWQISAAKVRSIEASYKPENGTPVFTVDGKYTARGWTEWTQGFQFGSAILQFDATGEREFLDSGKQRTLDLMAPHVSHTGVHDHGFNNVSTYGNLLRLATEGRMDASDWECHFYRMALKVSGAVQASRWTSIRRADAPPSWLTGDAGYIYSFNGPHSLFVDTIRSLRSLSVAHRLGHQMMGEGDRKISLLSRLLQHAESTARYACYSGQNRDALDLRGRTAHESIFNINDGNYRCPNSQQGFSPFTTWTRGLAWAILGFAEQLEFVATLSDAELDQYGGGRANVVNMLRATAENTADFYIDQAAALDGIPYWDTGAARTWHLGEFRDRPADPYNHDEPVDSSAAAIACQGLLRLGAWFTAAGDSEKGTRYRQAGLTVLSTLLEEPYLSKDPAHQGLILHSVYHQPNGWDRVHPGQSVPNGESSMWGDYHAREAALYVQRLAEGKPYLKFWAD